MLRRNRMAWTAAALVAGAGWALLGYVVEGTVGLLSALFISVGAIMGIACLAD
jgi:hypothetical protein